MGTLKIKDLELSAVVRSTIAEAVMAKIEPQLETLVAEVLADFPTEQLVLRTEQIIDRMITTQVSATVNAQLVKTIQTLISSELGDTWRQRGGMTKLIRTELQAVAQELQVRP